MKEKIKIKVEVADTKPVLKQIKTVANAINELKELTDNFFKSVGIKEVTEK